MNRYFVILILSALLCGGNAFAQYFPIYKKGKWGVIDSTGKVILPVKFDYVESFNNQLVIASLHDKLGVIDINGNERIPFQYEYLNYLSNDNYSFQSSKKLGIVNASNQIILPNEYEDIQLLAKNQYLAYKNNQVGLFQSNSFVIEPIYDSIKLFKSQDIYGAYSKNSIDVLDSNFRKYLSCGKMSVHEKTVYFYNVLLPNGDSLGSLNKLVAHYFVYSKNKKESIFDAQKNKLLFDYKYDQITYKENEKRFYLRFGDSLSIANLKGEFIATIKGSDRIEDENGFWFKENEKIGYVHRSGRTIPAIYDRILSNDRFFLTFNNSKKGLYTKSGRNILPSIYNEIIVDGDKIKAYQKNKMTLITLSRNGKIENKKEYTNFVKINLSALKSASWGETPLNPNPVEITGNRNLKYGWFANSRSLQNGRVITRFGIQFDDSVYLKPRYESITYLENDTVTKANLLPKRISESSWQKYLPHDFFIFNTSKKLNKQPFAFSKTENWKDHKMIHTLYGNFELRYFSSNGTLSEKMGYFDNYIDGMSRYMTYGDGPENVSNYDPISTYFVLWNLWRERPKKIEFKKGKWGFYNEKGEQKFHGMFTYVQNFKLKTSIVSKGNKFGVINQDSVVIEPKYSKISRISKMGDSLFIVSVKKPRKFLVDSLLRPYSFTYVKIFKTINDKAWIKKTGRSNGILNSNLEFGEIQGVIRKNFGKLLLVKRKGKSGLFDTDGNEIANVKYKEIKPFQSGFITKLGRKFGFLNADGNEILPAEFDEIIQATNEYVVAKKMGAFGLYDASGNLLIEHQQTHIHINPVSNEITVLTKPGKAYLWNKETEKLEKTKFIQANYVGTFGDYAVLKKRNQFQLIHSNGKLVSELEFTGIQVISEFIWELQIGKKKYTFNPKTGIFNDNYYRNSQHIFDYFVAERRQGFDFYNADGEIVKTIVARKISYEKGGKLMLVVDARGARHFNRNFENPIGRTFKKSTLFLGQYACVFTKNGWQIMNQKGYYITFPTFDNLRPIFNNVFEAQSTYLHGVFDSSGKEIVPVEYDQVKAINEKYFQAVTNGEIHYYKITGERIY